MQGKTLLRLIQIEKLLLLREPVKGIHVGPDVVPFMREQAAQIFHVCVTAFRQTVVPSVGSVNYLVKSIVIGGGKIQLVHYSQI